MSQVPEEILKKTSKCGSNFSCLSKEQCQCEILAVQQDACLLSVAPLSDTPCPYLVEKAAGKTMCSCPTLNFLLRGGETEQAHSEAPGTGVCPNS